MKSINLEDQVQEDQHEVLESAKPSSCERSSLKIYLVALAVRLFVAVFMLHTFHKGDEYFQGPQVAHKMVFGTGQLSWEWIFKDPIRGPLFPGFYAIGYYLLKILRLDGFLVLFSNFAHIQQAFMAALFDLLLVKINQKYNDKNTTPILLFFNWAGWTTVTYVSRTYVNSTQVVITMSAFYFWLRRNEQQKYDVYSRILASLGFVVRGTSVIFWIIVWPYELLKDHSSEISKALKFIKINIITVVGMILASILVSSVYYGKVIWVDYNFFYYNLLLNWSKLAGVSDSSQYFIHYQYKIFNVAALFLAWGIILAFKSAANQAGNQRNAKFRQLFGINLLCILFLTYNQHKELRFLLVYIPYLLIFVVRGYTEFPFRNVKKIMLIIFLLISSYEYVKRNFFIFNGPIEMVKYVRDNSHITNLYLLTGSFGMPMYAFIHRPISIHQVEYRYDDAMEGRKPEKEQFYQTPYTFLDKINKKYPNLTHFITRKGQVDELQMEKLSYDLEYEVKHPYFPNLALEYQLWRVVHDDNALLENNKQPKVEQIHENPSLQTQAIQLEQTQNH